MVNYLASIVLGLSGLAISVIAMAFSVTGLTLWIPDPEWHNVVVAMAITFGLVQHTVSVFLFHNISDKSFPIFFKIFLFSAVFCLMFISSAAIFVHLSKYAAPYLETGKEISTEVSNLEKRNADIALTIQKMDDQVNNLPPDMVRNRIKLYETFENEKKLLNEERIRNLEAINKTKGRQSEDKFDFLNGFSEITGWTRTQIYNSFILFLVILIDPLAASVIIAASFLFTKYREEAAKKLITQPIGKKERPFGSQPIVVIKEDDNESKILDIMKETLKETSSEQEAKFLSSESDITDTELFSNFRKRLVINNKHTKKDTGNAKLQDSTNEANSTKKEE